MASRSNQFIRFVPAGTTLPLQSHQRRPLSSQTLLLQANNWEFLFDLDEQLQFSRLARPLQHQRTLINWGDANSQ